MEQSLEQTICMSRMDFRQLNCKIYYLITILLQKIETFHRTCIYVRSQNDSMN